VNKPAINPKLAAALRAEPTCGKRRRVRRSIAAEHNNPVHLGFPPNLAKHCFGLQEPQHRGTKDEQLQKLLRQTIENVRRVEQIPEEVLRKYAWGMTEFPMLVSLRTTRKVIRDRLGPAGIDLSGDRGPGHRFDAHSANDEFSVIAEEFVFKLYGGPPGVVELDVWTKVLRPGMRLAFKDYLSENRRIAKKLESLIAQEHRRTPGVLRERVINRLLEKSKNFFGLKAQR
jgi:hypothetical protein